MKKIVFGAALVALSAGTAHAASGSTASATGTANATVIAPLKITHNTGALNFGAFTAGTGGTVVVTSAGAGSVTGDVGFVTVTGNTPTADSFAVTGDTTRSFTIATSSGNTVTSSSNSMAFTLTPAATTASLVGGAYTLNVGGTLTVASAQASGSYTGTYTVTVTYQ